MHGTIRVAERTLTDIAFKKMARQSSTYATWNQAGNAVDGILDTFQHTNSDPMPYWIVDLENTYEVVRVEVINRKPCCNGISLIDSVNTEI